MPSTYYHRQVGTQSIAGHGVGFALLAWIFLRFNLAGTAAALFLALTVLLLASFTTFVMLTCEVDRKEFRCRFGFFGWPGKIVPLDSIAGVVPARTALVSGFGVRVTMRGWLYSVSGRDAVIIGLRNGNQFLIGTDEPVKLADAINTALGRDPQFELIRGAR